MSLDELEFDRQVIQALREWADRHPEPEKPVLFLGQGRSFTPSELAKEVELRTSFGKKQLQVLRHFAETEPEIKGAKDIVHMFASAGRRPHTAF
jgi:hypothetical protein